MRKRLLAAALCLMLVMQPLTAKADNATVVTIGVDLTDSQEELMYEYFGVNKNQVAVIEVNNQDERKYLEGIAPDSQIGRKTFSCAYIEPTEAGKGINVKVANLNWVTSYMIATTLTTAGIYDCNVVVASPFIVSGTGALTGIMMAFESVTGTELEEEKKEAASEELVLNGNLAQQIGNDEATVIITEVKDTIIGENIVNAEQIEQVIIDKSTQYDITLTDEQVSMILGTMEKISALEYDYEAIKSTLSKIGESAAEKLGFTTEADAEDADSQAGEVQNFFAKAVQKVKDFFKSIGEWFKNLFTSNSAKEEVAEEEVSTEENADLGILQNTNDALLGEGAIIDATDESVITQPETDNSEDAENTENSEISDSMDGTEAGNGTTGNADDHTDGENAEGNAVTEDGTAGNNAENSDAESEASDSQSEIVTEENTDSQNSSNGSSNETETGTEAQQQSSGIVIQQESTDSYQPENLTGDAQ